MRKIAILAVMFALLGAIADVHMAAAQAAQQAKKKPSVTIALTANIVEQQSAAQPAAPNPVVITVQFGDTLSSIAAANGTTYMRLFDANNIINNPDLIYPGQQITVPASNEQLPDRTVPVPVPIPQTTEPVQVEAPAPAPSTPVLAPATTPATAPVAAETPAPVVAPAPTTAAETASSDDSATIAAAKAYIYMHESGDNPDATNSNGCYGLGQDCSGQVGAVCGDNYACQDEWFTNYANSRYGGWINAEVFWQAHGWW